MAGYFQASGTITSNDGLEDVFQSFIVGVTALPGKFVRPRWQPEPPPMPAVGVDWCAFAIKHTRLDDGPFIQNELDRVDYVRHEEIEISISFYGNHGQSFASIFRDGMAIPQNIAQLRAHQINYVGCTEVITAPDFLNQQYVHRYDTTATFRRKTERSFAAKK